MMTQIASTVSRPRLKTSSDVNASTKSRPRVSARIFLKDISSFTDSLDYLNIELIYLAPFSFGLRPFERSFLMFDNKK